MAAYGGGKPNFIEFITPVGLIAHLYHDKPQLKTKDQHGNVPDMDPETGIQRAEYKVTLAWEKSRLAELNDLVAKAQQVQAEAWPDSVKPGAFFQLEPFFRDGDNPAHNTKNKDYLRNCYYLNFKQKADAKRGPDGKVEYTGTPGLLGPYGPEDIILPGDLWAGCRGRVSGIMFGTEYAGRNFISVRLNNIQKYDEGNGTRIGGGSRPTASSQFDALKQGNPNPFGNAGAAATGGNAFGTANPFAPAPAQNPFGAPPSSPSNPFGGGFGGGRIL